MLYFGGSIWQLLLLVPLGRLVNYISTVVMGVRLYFGGSINLGSITGCLGWGECLVSCVIIM